MSETAQKQNNYKLIIYCILLTLTFFLHNGYIQFLITSMVFYWSWIKKNAISPLLYLATEIAITLNTSSLLSLIAVLPVYLCVIKKHSIATKNIIYMLCFGMLACISCVLGIKTNARTMALFLLGMFLFLGLSDQKIVSEDLKSYDYLSFLVICILLGVQITQTEIQLMYGRLSFNGSIREIAIAASFPVVVSFDLITSEAIKSKRENIMNWFIFLVGSLVLIATLSKGTIIAVFFGGAISFLHSKRKILTKIFILFIAVVMLIGVYSLLSSSNLFRLDRLTESVNGFSGRTMIWDIYWSSMKSSFNTLLFGFGPGDIKRLELTTSYSHSLFFDVLFSYGIIGFVAFVFIIITSGIHVFQGQQIIAKSLYIYDILLYSTHGVCTNVGFYIVLGISVAIATTMTTEGAVYRD